MLIPVLIESKKTSTYIKIKTDNAGTSGAKQVTLPLEASGTYNMVVKWGDGSFDRITAYNASAVTHSYIVAGTYYIEIIGTCWGWRYNNGGDCLKLLEILRWGKGFRLGNSNGYFYGCANLTITATDVPDLTGCTTLAYSFRGNSVLTKIPSLNSWDISKVTTLYAMFYQDTLFNQSLAGLNTSKVTTMQNMFNAATAFQQDISMLDYSLVTTMASMFAFAGMSTANYDKLLLALVAGTVQNGVTADFGSSKFTGGGAVEAAKTHLTTVHTWVVSDGGAA